MSSCFSPPLRLLIAMPAFYELSPVHHTIFCFRYPDFHHGLLGVLWGLRLRQTERELALSLPLMLPAAITRASTSGLHLFGAQYPPHLFPCLRFVVHLAIPNAKLGAEWIASPFS